jgi:hypothetical protein
MVSSLHVSSPKPRMHFSSPPYMLHVPPISSSLISYLKQYSTILQMVLTRATLTEIYDHNVGRKSVFEPVSYSWHRGMWPHLPNGLSTIHTGHIILNIPCSEPALCSVLWVVSVTAWVVTGKMQFTRAAWNGKVEYMCILTIRYGDWMLVEVQQCGLFSSNVLYWDRLNGHISMKLCDIIFQKNET